METDKMQSNDDKPDLNKIRPGLFWDTDIQKIDWAKQKRAVIERIIERGNEQEKAELKRFYGQDVFHEVAALIKARDQ